MEKHTGYMECHNGRSSRKKRRVHRSRGHTYEHGGLVRLHRLRTASTAAPLGVAAVSHQSAPDGVVRWLNIFRTYGEEWAIPAAAAVGFFVAVDQVLEKLGLVAGTSTCCTATAAVTGRSSAATLGSVAVSGSSAVLAGSSFLARVESAFRGSLTTLRPF